MIQQTDFSLSAKRRGFHIVTREILGNLPEISAHGRVSISVSSSLLIYFQEVFRRAKLGAVTTEVNIV